MNDSISDLIDGLNNVGDEPVEIELRCRITASKAKSIIEYCLLNNLTCSVDQSINFVNQDKYVANMTFLNNVKQPLVYYQKIPIINEFYFLFPDLKVKLAANIEKKVPEFDIKKVPEARLRIRFKANLNNWNIDITASILISNLAVNGETLKNARTTHIKERTINNFYESVDWKAFENIEFELEYAKSHRIFAIEDLQNAKKIIYNLVCDSEVVQIDEETDYQKIIYQIARYIKPKISHKFKREFGIKQLSNQVQELNKNIFVRDILPKIRDYYITPKLDGKRTLLYITDECTYAISDKLETKEEKSETLFLFDTEFYQDSYYIFDVLIWEGKVIAEQTFVKRIRHFKDAKNKFPNLIKIKAFQALDENTFRQDVQKMLEDSKSLFEIDGLVLTPMDESYNEMKVYKYKPRERLTCDFLIKQCPAKLLGIKPYEKTDKTLYLLFCGISLKTYQQFSLKLVAHYEDIFPQYNKRHLPQYFPIQFEPSEMKYDYMFYDSDPALDGKIGEFSYDKKWKLIRIREDRDIEVTRGNYFGNNYKVAEMIWMNLLDPLVIETFETKGYFAEHDNPGYKAMRNFNSFVKFTVLKSIADDKEIKWAVDLAAGKGQDLFRYEKLQIPNLLMIDNDSIALQELIERKYNLELHPLNLMIKKLNLLDNYKENLKKIEQARFEIPAEGVDLVVCNFAIHYFLESKKTAKNFLSLVSNLLKRGGAFTFCAFDGLSVLHKLNGNLVWNTAKYSVKTDKPIQELEAYGQTIDVLLPFSDGQYYREYIVNIESIKEDLATMGLSIEFHKKFGSFLGLYQTQNAASYNSLSDEDREFLSLYSVTKFRKINN